MLLREYRPVLACAALALVALAGGCRDTAAITADDVISHMLEFNESHPRTHTRYTGDYFLGVPGEGPQHVMKARIEAEGWAVWPDKERIEMRIALDLGEEAEVAGIDGELPYPGNALIVRNGSRMWFYQDSTNLWYTIDLADEATEAELYTYGQLVRSLSESHDVTYLGPETMAGREAHRLRAKHKDLDASGEPDSPFGGMAGADIEFVVDAQSWQLLQWSAAYPDASAGTEEGSSVSPEADESDRYWMSVSFDLYEVDVPVSDDLFVFTPPEGSTEIDYWAMMGEATAP